MRDVVQSHRESLQQYLQLWVSLSRPVSILIDYKSRCDPRHNLLREHPVQGLHSGHDPGHTCCCFFHSRSQSFRQYGTWPLRSCAQDERHAGCLVTVVESKVECSVNQVGRRTLSAVAMLCPTAGVGGRGVRDEEGGSRHACACACALPNSMFHEDQASLSSHILTKRLSQRPARLLPPCIGHFALQQL